MIEITLTFKEFLEFKNIANGKDRIDMKDVSIMENQQLIKNTVSSVINADSFFYGNIFRHSTPFSMHSDINDVKKSILLIPIEAPLHQKFIVFDQTINQSKQIAWIYNIFADKSDEELKQMYYDEPSKSRPYDTPNVVGLTDQPIDEKLFRYLPYNRDFYFGLTGKVWDYVPGKALLFPANRIHATGRMTSPKMACTIGFTDTVDNLRSSLKEHILL